MASLASVDLPGRKRKRRRRQDKPAISARLVLDDHVKGDVGILSDDLLADLFPHLKSRSFCLVLSCPSRYPLDTLSIVPCHSLLTGSCFPTRRRARRECASCPRCPPCCPRPLGTQPGRRDHQLDHRPRHSVCRSCTLDRTVFSLLSRPAELRDPPPASRALEAFQPQPEWH